jgi:peroxiredoxin
MPNLAEGDAAPDFIAPSSAGQPVSLAELTSTGPAVLIFFKITCPVCRMGMGPFGRLAATTAAPVVAVSQDPLAAARPWLRQAGFAGLAIDDSEGFPISLAYGIHTVPTLFLIGPGRMIERTFFSWDRQSLTEMTERLAELTGEHLDPVSTSHDGLPAVRPG